MFLYAPQFHIVLLRCVNPKQILLKHPGTLAKDENYNPQNFTTFFS